MVNEFQRRNSNLFEIWSYRIFSSSIIDSRKAALYVDSALHIQSLLALS